MHDAKLTNIHMSGTAELGGQGDLWFPLLPELETKPVPSKDLALLIAPNTEF